MKTKQKEKTWKDPYLNLLIYVSNNEYITIQMDAKYYHEQISFIPDDIDKTWNDLISNMDKISEIFSFPTIEKNFYPKKFDYSDYNKKKIEEMNRDELIDYINNGKTHLKKIDKMFFTDKLEKLINNDIYRVEYRRILDIDYIQKEMKDFQLQPLYSLNVKDKNIDDSIFDDFLNKNAEKISKFINENYKYIHSFNILYKIIMDELICIPFTTGSK